MKAPELCNGCKHLLYQTEPEHERVIGFWCLRNAKYKEGVPATQRTKNYTKGFIAVSNQKAECKHRVYV
jgi:hypothetical protein